MIVKVTVLFAIAILAAMAMRRAAAATRHALLLSAQVAALALPLLPSFVPVSEDAFVGGRVLWSAAVRAAAFQSGGEAAALHGARTVHLDSLWLVGFVLVSAWKARAIVRALRIVRRAKDGYSADIDQPMTFGARILLPESAKTWSEERRSAVLLHERAHVQRRDTLLALLGDLTCAVYWFHPLAWVIERSARIERERACDDVVLEAGIAADDYAQALVDVARTRAFALPMAAPSQLETRIVAILNPRVARKGSRAIAIAMLALAPALAALEADIVRPRTSEPDLRNDSPPQSELLPRVDLPRIETSDPFIILMKDQAAMPPRDAIDYVPERARWALAQIEDGRLVEPLLERLHDRDWRVRAYAAWALGYSGDKRATAPLTAMLHDDRWRLRAMAAHSLANLGDPAAEEAMVSAIGDEAWQVRTEVARYLGIRGTHREMLRALRSDRHVMVRTTAEEGMR